MVQPVLTKIDVDGLKRDLNKFQEYTPEEAATFWSQWVTKVDILVDLPEKWEWTLDKILNSNKIRPSSVDCTMPDNLQALQDKERNPTRQVGTTQFFKETSSDPPRKIMAFSHSGLLPQMINPR